MEFFEAVKARRSIRKYTLTPVPAEVIHKALDAALIAPNSSNLQTWEFFWVRTPAIKKKLVEACLNQSAARTAQELIVVVANPSLWKRTRPEMAKFVREVKAPKMVHAYYDKLVPAVYGYLFLAPFKWLAFNLIGIFKPIVRRPVTRRDIEEVSIKSAALASENFMLAITAQGFASCPMEGFDEPRVKKMLKLSWGSRVVMVISVGEGDLLRGTWGPQIRFQRDWFVKEI
jgi:nitroreductase